MGRLSALGATLIGCAIGVSIGNPAIAGCGAAQSACEIAEGSYHIVLPEEDWQHRPAVMFLHGYGGSGAGVLQMTAMVEAFIEHGYAVIAPDGAERSNGRRSWSFRGDLATRDDFAFLPAVLKDSAARFGVAPEQTVLAGFSAGAFMVNYLACAQPETFAAYLPVSGGFWRPQPDSCEGPVKLYHSHGWSDGTVPLEGRPLGSGRYVQGDIWAGLNLWRETLSCDSPAPEHIWRDGSLMLRGWSCGAGGEIVFELFPGGHRVPEGWAERVLSWLNGAKSEVSQRSD